MVRNAVMSGPVAVTVPPASASALPQTNDPTSCSCNVSIISNDTMSINIFQSVGCVGSGCAQLNGCFCIGQSCWGAACQSPVMQPQPQFSPQISQQVAQQVLPNQQSANFIFGGGGGGGDIDSQTIPVVKGIPVKRLRGQGARGSMRQHSQGRMRYARPPGMGRGRGRQRQRNRLIRDGMQTSSTNNKDQSRSPMFAAISVNGIPSVMRISGPQSRSSSVDFVRSLGSKITESVNQFLWKGVKSDEDKTIDPEKDGDGDDGGEEEHLSGREEKEEEGEKEEKRRLRRVDEEEDDEGEREEEKIQH